MVHLYLEYVLSKQYVGVLLPHSDLGATLQDISAVATRELYTSAPNALPDGAENRVVGG